MKNNINNIILMFPGQGSQHAGMGSEFLKKNIKYGKYFKIASEISGTSLLDIIEGSKAKTGILDRTEYSQIAIYTLSCVLNDYLFEKNGKLASAAGFAVGHSLGDYSALYSSRAYSFEKGAEFVSFRGKIMSEAGGSKLTGKTKKMMMSAVIGLDIETISKVLESYRESVFIANINDFSQIVISGYEDELLKASQKLVEAGTKKIIPLKVNIASHCPLMNGVSKTLEKYFGDNFKIPVTLSQAYFSSTEVSQVKPEDIPRVLINQLIKPVRWVESVQYLTSLYPADGSLKAFIEVGPGKVLSGLVRRILSKTGREDFMVFNTDSMEEIERI